MRNIFGSCGEIASRIISVTEGMLLRYIAKHSPRYKMGLPAPKRKVMPVATITPTAASYTRSRSVGSQQHVLKALAVNGWPLVGVGSAMAASAWLPANNPSLGFAVFATEILLGAFAIVRLLSLVKN
jgi:hypothetical protein